MEPNNRTGVPSSGAEDRRHRGARLEMRIPDATAQTRIVCVARSRLDPRKFVRAFKGIICADIPEFESYMPSHAVGSLPANMPARCFRANNQLGAAMVLYAFKGIICGDISEFESYMPRQAVRSLGASSGLQKYEYVRSANVELAAAIKRVDRTKLVASRHSPR
jgi:hypothetical protein